MRNFVYSMATLDYALGAPTVSGCLKQTPDDFIVEEIMPVQPSGAGEHLWIQVCKSSCNTEWLARQLARVAGVRPMAVGYAGLKDRHGRTTQWFSIHLPGQADPDLSALVSDQVQILQQVRHDRKLKRGALAGNRFQLRIRQLKGDRDNLLARLDSVAASGVPNYFGAQRFGHNMDNLNQAEALFDNRLTRVKRHQRSLYLSAARSWIFNQVLSRRVQLQNWNGYLPGDVFQLQGKTACFSDDGSDDIPERLARQVIHPTGPLWGKGESMARHACLELEREVASGYSLFCTGIEREGMKQERRALRLLPGNPVWEIDSDGLLLCFDLPAGTYATIILREVVELQHG